MFKANFQQSSKFYIYENKPSYGSYVAIDKAVTTSRE